LEEVKSETPSDQSPSNSLTDEVRKNKLIALEERERRAGVTLGLLILAFALSWILMWIANFLLALKTKVPRMVFHAGLLLGTVNNGINPIIYAVRNVEFQQCFRNIWKRFSKCIYND